MYFTSRISRGPFYGIRIIFLFNQFYSGKYIWYLRNTEASTLTSKILKIGICGFVTLCPHDAHVIPHRPADFVPVMGDHDQFIGVMGVAGLPGRNLTAAGAAAGSEGPLGGAMGADDGLEQGVAGQAVGAVQAGAGHFADRLESRDFGFARPRWSARPRIGSGPPARPGSVLW